MSNVYTLIIAGGVIALLYGVYAIRSVLAAPAGTDRMQEIASAIQEGARAYLNRQYMTIGMVGVVIFVILLVLLGYKVGIGFAIGNPIAPQPATPMVESISAFPEILAIALLVIGGEFKNDVSQCRFVPQRPTQPDRPPLGRQRPDKRGVVIQ